MLVSPSIAYQNLLIRLSNQHTTLPRNRNSTAPFHQTSHLQKHSKRDSCLSTSRETFTSFPQMALSSPSIFSTSVHKFNPLSLYRHKLSPRFLDFSKNVCVSVSASSNNGVFTSPETAKSFDFTAEERIYNWWESQGYFKPNTDSGGDPFVISMPPPNVTGSLHMGHAMFVTLEDIMVRYFRMKGRSTLWVPGTDHAGIATQLVVERMLASEGIKRVDLGREEFNKRVLEWKAKYGGTITEQIKRLGASCDWSRERFTLDDQLSNLIAIQVICCGKRYPFGCGDKPNARAWRPSWTNPDGGGVVVWPSLALCWLAD